MVLFLGSKISVVGKATIEKTLNFSSDFKHHYEV